MEASPPDRRTPLPGGVPAARRLWLVRHGQSTWNALGLVQGHAAAPGLTTEGARQAEGCAEILAAQPIGAVYSSDLRRALETAGPIGRRLRLEVAVDARLRERSYGAAEGAPVAQLVPEESGLAGGRVVDADAAPAGGESVRQMYLRVCEAVAAIAAEPLRGDVVLVCHGGVVRVVLAWLDGAGPEAMAWGPVGNGLVVARPMPAMSLVARG